MLYYNRKGSLTDICMVISTISLRYLSLIPLLSLSYLSLICLFRNKRINGEETGRIGENNVSLSGKPAMPIGIFVAFQSVLLRCFSRYFCGEMRGERPGKIYCIGQVSIALFNVSSI